MRTSKDIYDRLRFDSVADNENVIIGYLDRFDGK